jgi:hypothetical protein
MRRFIYQVRHADSQFFYEIEGDAIQAARRSAEELTNTRSGLYAITEYRISLWSDETMVISDMTGKSLVHVSRHPVL